MKSNRYLVTLAVLALATPQLAFGTALDDYVAAHDANYRYSLADTIKGEGYTAYVMDMTSQSWRNGLEVDRTLWQHWLTIIKPDKATGNKALLWINSGSNAGSAPTKADQMLVRMALSTSTVVADLRMVPKKGWTAFFVELIYDSGGKIPYKFTTQVHVVPERLPFADKLKSGSANLILSFEFLIRSILD